MKLLSARVKNYKSYFDTHEIAFGERFTVIVGQNSAGKTAFLEALKPRTFRSIPHRTPQRGAFPPNTNPQSDIEYEISISGPELEHSLLWQGGQFSIPIPDGMQFSDGQRFLTDMFALPKIKFKVSHPAASASWNSVFPSHGLFREAGNATSIRLDVNPDRQGWTGRENAPGPGDSLPEFLGLRLEATIYTFRAERMNVGESPIGDTAELAPDASNLPSVLLQLPRSPAAHDRYLASIREIFPSIYRVAARPMNAQTAKIEIIMNDSEAGTSSPGIDVPLSESGTGVSQVLALMYVAVTAQSPRIIIIDEPNSFLHPGAAKKLLTILKEFDHQYIVSTHSADLIRTADPEYLHLIEWEKTASKFQTLDRKNLDDHRRLLVGLGINLSDVFGADSVLWVEGQTEEICFPILLHQLGLASPAISIVAIAATDDFVGRRARARLAWEVYRKLTYGNALVPPALAFSLDREGRSAKEIADLSRESRGKVKFLPRRTYENYLIDNDAISNVLTAELGEPVAAEKIGCWIELHRNDRAYQDRPLTEGDDWASTANAPQLLHDLFNALTDAKVEYRKTQHSLALTEWLLANKPEELEELFGFLKGLVPPHGATTS